MKRDFPHESEVSDGTDQSALDTSSPPWIDARHSVDAPYRDRHDALVHRHRALAREHDEASRAAARRDRLARQLEVIDEQLRDDARPLLASLPTAGRCRSRWDDMPGTDTCRRCSRCGHDVHDLARLTRHEADALVSRLGGRLRKRPDGRVVAAECPREGAGMLGRIATAGVVGAVAGGAMVLALAAPPAVLVHVARTRAPRVAVVPAAPPLPVVRVEALRSELPRPPQLEQGVRLLGPGTYEVDRASLAELASSIERSARVAPDPHRRGVRVYGVRRDTVAHALGVRNGDVILDVNGLPPARSDRVDAQLRSRDLFVVRLLRRGEEHVLVYHVRGRA